jgi:DNA helicase-2/ATP-dependent DNA helicase PcrA
LQGHETVQEFVNQWLGQQIEGIESFRALVDEFVHTAETPADVLRLLNEAISQPDIPPDVTVVRIMSLHKSKGLNSPVVVIAGCIKGLLPSDPDDEPTPEEQVAHLEEQRRLFYVGLTRVKADPAKNWPGTLLLTSSWTMTSRAAKQSKLPDGSFGVANGRATVQTSQFIRELGPAAPASRPG